MKIIVTGGAGFIGSHFVKSTVAEGFDVTVVDKLTYAGCRERIHDVEDSIEFLEGDVADCSYIDGIVDTIRPDMIVHFAAESHVDRSILRPDDFIRTNILGTFNLLNASLKTGLGRFVHISTDEVYGELSSGEGLKFSEGDCLLPNSPYSASKASADMMVRGFHRTYGLPAVIVRPSNNYGPWQYPEKLIPLTIAKAILGEGVPVYGRGENVRTWLFVDDCADAILRIAERGVPGEIYNVGSNEERRNIDVVRRILEVLGARRDLVEFVPDRPGHDFRYAVSTERIEDKLGWKPRCDIDTGLEKTVRWYVENKKWLFKKKREVDAFITNLQRRFRDISA